MTVGQNVEPEEIFGRSGESRRALDPGRIPANRSLRDKGAFGCGDFTHTPKESDRRSGAVARDRWTVSTSGQTIENVFELIH
jgi:hypothetical protein